MYFTMKTFSLFLILALGFNVLNAQHTVLNINNNSKLQTSNSQFDTVDAKVRSYGSDFNTSKDLSERILKDFSTQKNRIRALYTWLCLNIRYDLDAYKSGQTAISFSYTSKADFNKKMKAINNKIVDETIRTNKALCEGYAQTFKQVSEQLGIQCEVIGGYAKSSVDDIGNVPNQENHAWNAVRINEKWYLVDATWGAGHFYGDRWTTEYNDFYFLTQPDAFSKSHYPTDKKWFLSETTMTKKQFYDLPIFKRSFFENNLELIWPKSGIIIAEKDRDITFLMGSVPENIPLYYAYKDEKYSDKLEVDCNNKQCTFNVPFAKDTDNALYIFADKKPILEFLIKRKS